MKSGESFISIDMTKSNPDDVTIHYLDYTYNLKNLLELIRYIQENFTEIVINTHTTKK